MATVNGAVSGENGQSDSLLNAEQIEDLSNAFDLINSNGDGSVPLAELQRALEVVGIKLAGYRVRDLINERYRNMGPTGTLSMTEFGELYGKLKWELDPKFKERIKHVQNVQQIQGMSEASNYDILHTVRNEEQVAFSNWINSNLISDIDLKDVLPLTEFGDDLYQKVPDGLIICKLINLAVPDTIDERAINKKQLSSTYIRIENLTLALNSARAIGVNIVNIDADDIIKGKQHLVLGLLWQIIRIGLFREITLVNVPGLVRLLQEGENLSDLQRLSPEQILLRWVNYHLAQAGLNRKLTNFTTDVVDSEIYTHLMHQIAPTDRAVSLDPLQVKGDNIRRATLMLKEADKLGCRAFVTPNDVSNGVYKLNLAFVANLFNTWPALKPPAAEEAGELPVVELEEIEEETREERTYRNWMNSVGVNPYVNWLYSDLSNGLIIFQLYDVIKAGHVDWKRVVTKYKKFGSMMDQIQNCNYAIDLGKKIRFSLVGIQGKDIYDGNRTLTLALVWQLMRSYTLTLLANCTQSSDRLATDKEIVEWANQKLKSVGKKSSVSSFQDPALSDARVIVDLIDAIQPNVIDYSIVRDSYTNQDKLANARYAVTTARKIGAKVYALPEDIVEVKPKMLLTVFACLMALDYMPNVRECTLSKSQPPPVPAKPSKPAQAINGHGETELNNGDKASEVIGESEPAAARETGTNGEGEWKEISAVTSSEEQKQVEGYMVDREGRRQAAENSGEPAQPAEQAHGEFERPQQGPGDAQIAGELKGLEQPVEQDQPAEPQASEKEPKVDGECAGNGGEIPNVPSMPAQLDDQHQQMESPLEASSPSQHPVVEEKTPERNESEWD